MAETKDTSFLAAFKGQLEALFAEANEEMANAFDEGAIETIPETMRSLQRKTWSLCEATAKQSFVNGRRAASNGARKPTAETKREGGASNPFRR